MICLRLYEACSCCLFVCFVCCCFGFGQRFILTGLLWRRHFFASVSVWANEPLGAGAPPAGCRVKWQPNWPRLIIYFYSVCLKKAKIIFDHVDFLPLTNTSLQSACNKSRRKKNCVLSSIQLFLCLKIFNQSGLEICFCLFLLGVQSVLILLWTNEALIL